MPQSALSKMYFKLCALCAGANTVKSRSHRIAKLGNYLPIPNTIFTSPTTPHQIIKVGRKVD